MTPPESNREMEAGSRDPAGDICHVRPLRKGRAEALGVFFFSFLNVLFVNSIHGVIKGTGAGRCFLLWWE